MVKIDGKMRCIVEDERRYESLGLSRRLRHKKRLILGCYWSVFGDGGDRVRECFFEARWRVGMESGVK